MVHVFDAEPIWGQLTKSRPVWSGIAFFFFVGVVVVLLNMYDILYGRGEFARPGGHLSWWVIPIFDWIGLPFFAWRVAVFVHLTRSGSGSLPARPVWTIVALVIAAGVTVAFIKTGNGSDWGKVPGATFSSLNWYGRYHTLVFFLSAWFLFSFLIRGGLYVWSAHDPVAAKAFWQAAAVFVASFGGAQLLDIPIRMGWGINPNQLIALLTGAPRNW